MLVKTWKGVNWYQFFNGTTIMWFTSCKSHNFRFVTTYVIFYSDSILNKIYRYIYCWELNQCYERYVLKYHRHINSARYEYKHLIRSLPLILFDCYRIDIDLFLDLLHHFEDACQHQQSKARLCAFQQNVDYETFVSFLINTNNVENPLSLSFFLWVK